MDVSVVWASWSNLLIYSAMAVYAIAFIIYSLDLFGDTAQDKSQAKSHTKTAAKASAVARTSRNRGGGVAVAERDDDFPVPVAETDNFRRWARVGTALTVLAVLMHVGAVVTRTIAVMRVPWGNMMEYALVASALAVVTYLAVLKFRDLRFMGTFVAGFALITLGLCITVFYTPAAQLIPALQSYWIYIHVPIAILSTALLTVSAVIAIFQLLTINYEKRVKEDRPIPKALRFLARTPASDRIEIVSYRLAAVGFITWTFTLIAGAIWAEVAWGRPWGWDTKEIWTFVVWVIYAAYLHARATRGWSQRAIAILNLVGFSTVLFNFAVVNIYFNGLHSYSGLE